MTAPELQHTVETERLKRFDEARCERAASLAGNQRERELLRERAANAKPT